VEGGDETVESRREAWAESQREVSGGDVRTVGTNLRPLSSKPSMYSHLPAREGIQFHRTTRGRSQGVQHSRPLSVAFHRDVYPDFHKYREEYRNKTLTTDISPSARACLTAFLNVISGWKFVSSVT